MSQQSSFEDDLERLFPQWQRNQLFAESLEAAESREEIRRARNNLSSSIDLKSHAINATKEIWSEAAPVVEEHLNFLRTREQLVTQIRLALPTPDGGEIKELQDSREEITRRYASITRNIDNLKARRGALLSRQISSEGMRSAIEIKRALIELSSAADSSQLSIAHLKNRTALNTKPKSQESPQADRLNDVLRRLDELDTRLSERQEFISLEKERTEGEISKLERAASTVGNSLLTLDVQIGNLDDKLLRVDPRVRNIDEAISESSRRLAEWLAEQGILPRFWKAINDAQEDLYGLTIPSPTAPLGGSREEIYVRTDAWRRVERLIDSDSPRGLSLGIAGPRGAGKTTLIERMCLGRGFRGRPGIGLVTHAPFDYAPSEFVLHLFAELSRKVIEVFGQPISADVFVEYRNVWVRRLTWIISGITVLALAAISAAVISMVRQNSSGIISWVIGFASAAVLALVFQRDAVIQARHAWRGPTGSRMGSFIEQRLSIDIDRWSHGLRRLTAPPALIIEALVSAALLAVLVPLDDPGSVRGVLALFGALLIIACVQVGNRLLQRIVGAPFGNLGNPSPDFEEKSGPEEPEFEEPGPDVLRAFSRVATARAAQRVLLHTGLIVGGLMLWGLHIIGGEFSARLAGEIFVGLLSLITLAHAYELRSRLLRIEEGRSPSETARLGQLSRAAADNLELVEYQLSVTHGTTAIFRTSPRFAVGFEAQRKGEQTARRQEMTFPELVSKFRKFAESVARVQPLIIGIDELDKIHTPDGAHAFLNSIKSVFGSPNCYYIVSVSEDASAEFERRGIPFRTAFDSCFDEVVHVGYLDFVVAQRLLSMRPPIMTRPVQALCYCLAGGLAREMVRCQRHLIQGAVDSDIQSQEVPVVGENLPSAVSRIVREQIRAQASAVAFSIRGEPDSASLQSLLAMYRRLLATEATTDSLLALCQAPRGRAPVRTRHRVNNQANETSVQRMGNELVAFVYFEATVLEFFDQGLTRDRAQRAEHVQSPESYDQLALARRSFSSGPAAVWHETNVFRRAWGMSVLGGSPFRT
ncbi:hypothetical protein ACH419_09715 [Streptomyces bobili]|uniref:hypothetical protein n=1 Tax=Streptomyces bobili TaxID=67280 RepID=UPI0037A20478